MKRIRTIKIILHILAFMVCVGYSNELWAEENSITMKDYKELENKVLELETELDKVTPEGVISLYKESENALYKASDKALYISNFIIVAIGAVAVIKGIKDKHDMDALKRTMDESRKTIDELERTIDESRKMVDEYKDKLTDYQEGIGNFMDERLEEETDRLENYIEDLDKELDVIKERLEKLEDLDEAS